MAIYRPSRPRYKIVAIAGIVGFLLGLIAALVLGGGGEEDPVEAARAVRVSLSEASSVLEIVEIEYAEAAGNGAPAGREYEGAKDALARSRALWSEARPALEVLAPDRAEEINRRYAALEQALEEQADVEQVGEMIDRLTELLEPGDS